MGSLVLGASRTNGQGNRFTLTSRPSLLPLKGQGPGLVNVLWAERKTTRFNLCAESEHFSKIELSPERIYRRLQKYSERHGDGNRPCAQVHTTSAPHTWKCRRASSGQERLSSARRRPGASPRSSARKTAYWRKWRRLLRQPTLHRHLLIRTAPGKRASRSRPRDEPACPSG